MSAAVSRSRTSTSAGSSEIWSATQYTVNVRTATGMLRRSGIASLQRTTPLESAAWLLSTLWASPVPFANVFSQTSMLQLGDCPVSSGRGTNSHLSIRC